MAEAVESAGGGSSLSPAYRALARMARSFNELVKVVEDGGLDGLDDLGFVGFMQGFESQRNRLPLIDHRVIRSSRLI